MESEIVIVIFIIVLWPLDQLLGKSLEVNNEIVAAAMQRRSNYVSTTVELMLETVFSPLSVQRCYKE
jgi:hypothetical protein